MVSNYVELITIVYKGLLHLQPKIGFEFVFNVFNNYDDKSTQIRHKISLLIHHINYHSILGRFSLRGFTRAKF
jgi:hypothetical protein